ncbi:MAG: 1-acyl-sn-glycerol-3-phosphate acyltransferase [Bacteroidales bacterium]|nr:1-acyl-sn-glycerol-3-phosphate acyltransferase [Bacteroidales bacterium]
MDKLFLYVYHFFQKRRLRLFIIITLLTAFATFLASRIRLEEDINRMISGDGTQGLMSRVVEQSKMLDKIIVTVSAADTTRPLIPEELIRIGDQFADSLNAQAFAPFVKGLTYRMSDTLTEALFDIVYENLPLFLEEEDYSRLDTLLRPENIQAALNNNLRSLLSPASFTMKRIIVRDPVGIGTMALGRLGSYQNDENYTLLDGCVFSRDKKHLMMFISPALPSNETSGNSGFVKKLGQLASQVAGSYENQARIEYFGSAIVAVGNADRLKRDIRFTLTITIILLSLIITFSVKKKKLFPFIFLPAVFGGLVALAFLYLFQGKISVISLSIGSVIMAITVDYALHITTHYKHKHSIIDTIKDVSFPIIVCGFATAFEFLTLVFVSSESLHELGILAAISVLTAAFFTMVVLPHILDATRSEKDETEEKNYLERVLDKITLYSFHKNKLLLLFMALVTILSLYYLKRVGFETDMMKMNYMSDELKKTEENLNRINNAKLNSVYLVAHGSNMQKALISNENVLRKADALIQQGVIKSYSSPSSLLMSDSLQLQKIDRWNSFWQKKGKDQFLESLDEKAIAAGFKPSSFGEFSGLLKKEFSVADSATFKALEKIFFVDNISVTPSLATIVTILKVDNRGKEQVTESYGSMDGVVVIDRKSILSGIVNTLGEDFSFIANVSLLLILGVLIFAFGRIELGVITFIPIFFSWIWTMGFMGFFGIRFNIFNIIISSFITGLGIDYSIYIMQGLVQGYKTENANLLSYKTCILISVMISISGTGVLILAQHPALHSIALISIVGLLSVVLISYTFEPVFFYWLVSKKNRKRLLPVTLSDILLTIIVFSIFVTGCLIMNLLLGIVVLLPLPSRNKKLIMHRCMVFWCKVPVYAMLHIRKKIINLGGEDFSKPAIIISNHQSHIDLLLLLMLHPKMIVLTTKWVWNNPIYALVIRYLDYYPVLGGYEELTDKLKAKVNEGYSILVFPEGSRSADSSIRRFHKGAFLMAEKLGLDMIPIILHGAGDCMNKGENHLRGGSITIKIYPRVQVGDKAYGANYHERTKLMLAFYRREYAILKEEFETPDYFRKKLIRNYIYKGPVLEWYTRIKLSLENNYNLINSFVPREAKIVDIGCGYGYLSYLLSFVSPKRKITGIDYDADKIDMANHCISKNEHVNFFAADAIEFSYDFADVFILSDVLHYMSHEKQEVLLEKCIRNLNPKGVIIVRDADRDMEKRHRGTRYTEFFSTRSGFNKSDQNRLFFLSGKTIREFAAKHNLQTRVIDNSRLTSNVLFVLNNIR